MKIELIDRAELKADDGGDCPDARRLILFFAGWGMDSTPFKGMSKPGYDVSVVYDYNDNTFDIEAVAGYDEICVLAWSLGVWHADSFISDNPTLPITRTIAVNGTLNPISDTEGIAPRIYDLTSRLPDGRALEKFYRRICGGQEGLERLLPERPRRELDNLRDELSSIRRRIAGSRITDTSRWDEIYISDSDLIFPFENMLRAWSNASRRVRVMHGQPHAVDFNDFIAMAFVDKSLVGHRFASASSTYGSEARVQHSVAEILVDFAKQSTTGCCEGRNVLEIGSGVGVLTRQYQPILTGSRIALWDLTPSPVESINGNIITAVRCDAETCIGKLPPGSVDMIFSSSTMQWFNSPRRFLERILHILAPGGMAYLSCYVDGTIPQVAEVTGATAMHYPYLGDVLSSLKDVDCQSYIRRFDLTFDTPSEALAHMRATGVNALARKKLSVADTRRLMRLLTVDGQAVLTFNTQFIILKKHG